MVGETSVASEDVLTTVINDESFKIKTPAFRRSAVKILEWCLQAPNKYQVEIFGKKLMQGVICFSIKKSYECNKKKCGENISHWH